MRIGILGATGPAGRGLAARLASVGHEVLFGSRAVDKARAAVTELEKEWGDRVAGPPDRVRQRVGVRRAHRDPRGAGRRCDPDRAGARGAAAGQDRRVDGEQPREARQRVQRGAAAARVGRRGDPGAALALAGRAPRSTSCPRPSSRSSTTRWRATSSCSATTTKPSAPSWRSPPASRTCARSTAARCENAVGMETFAAVLLTVNIRHKMRAEPAPQRHLYDACGSTTRRGARSSRSSRRRRCACTCAGSRRTTRPTSGTRRRTSPTTSSPAGSRSSATRCAWCATSPTSTTRSCPKARELGVPVPRARRSRDGALPQRHGRARDAPADRRAARDRVDRRASSSSSSRLLESGHAYLTARHRVLRRLDASNGSASSRTTARSRWCSWRAHAAATPTTRTGARPLDFVLWQPSLADEPAWRAPFGVGRPGWHIECSAMAMHEHGPTLDLHGGGTDLIFPHHECEIAQSEAITGEPFVKHWLHSAMVNYEGEKMSKSLGNLVFISDLLKHGRPARDPARVAAPPLPPRLRVVRHRSRRGHRARCTGCSRPRPATRRTRPASVRGACARRDRRRPRRAARARRARRPRERDPLRCRRRRPRPTCCASWAALLGVDLSRPVAVR